ncbi:ABC transporter permease [Amycolatopsis alkalitolerans]|uniref:ABC transporter permease n=1 Tax=Amycolatopsis alkalitolerans TaxID=2547244 RepID=A0A5C4LUI8_9PSEU|nr:ABC transporter permease [Amycolatopsis alkalitolerans]TNC21813.1 ABC transporter permease [Amycolatopsis alkalitolerans]
MSEWLVRARRSPMAIVVGLVLVLLVVNLAITPEMLGPGQLPGTVKLLVPSVLAAMASVPSVMSGRGGIDLSVGPALGLVNVFLVGLLLPYGLGDALVAIPLLLALGSVIGLVNGLLVARLRLQPVVVTLGGYLVFSGVALVVLPQPASGVPSWIGTLSGAWLGGFLPLPVVFVLVAVAVWLVLRRLGAVNLILATGSEDRAAFTSGVRVPRVLCLAYATGGFFAALAGLALTVLIASGDPAAGRQYTLAAIAAVALGGNPLSGGRGTMTGPVLGAVALFLIQTLLSGARVSSLWIQVVYGLVLLGAICLNSSVGSRLTARPVEVPR